MSPRSTDELGLLLDSDLVGLVRQGHVDAYHVLWQRHWASAYTCAKETNSAISAEDAVSDAFEVILSAIQRGYGPTDNFRSYLFSTIRHNVAHSVRDNLETPVEDVGVDHAAVGADPSRAYDALSFDSEAVSLAFYALNERYRTVLWLSEVETRKPREIAKDLDMSAANVSMVAFRARESFRKNYDKAVVQLAAKQAESGERGMSPLGRKLFTGVTGAAVTSAAGSSVASAALIVSPPLMGGIGVGGVVIGAGIAGAGAVAAGAAAGASPAFIAGVLAGGAMTVTALSLVVVVLLPDAPASVVTPPSATATSSTTAPAAPSPSPSTSPTQTPAATSQTTSTRTPAPEPEPTGTASSPTPVVPAVMPVAITGVDSGLHNTCYPRLSGTGTPGATLAVTVAYESTSNVTVDSTGAWQTGFLTGFTAGRRSITVSDSGGQSSPASVDVDLAAPPSIGVSATGNSVEYLVNGLAGVPVVISIDDNPAATVTIGPGGSTTGALSWTGTPGAHKVTVAYHSDTCPTPTLSAAFNA